MSKSRAEHALGRSPLTPGTDSIQATQLAESAGLGVQSQRKSKRLWAAFRDHCRKWKPITSSPTLSNSTYGKLIM
jgi:hypothetical protein